MKADRNELWSKENATADSIPYSVLVDQNTVKLESGDFLQVIKVDGVAHESADEEDINAWRDQLNLLFRNFASPNIALWTHVVRREVTAEQSGNFQNTFAKTLDDKYYSSLRSSKMMVNELYLSVLYRPTPNKAGKLLSFLNKKGKDELKEEQLDHLEKINETVSNICSGLYIYDPRVLTTYEKKNKLYSETLAFLGFLVNGEWLELPVPRSHLSDYLPCTRPYFGVESFEIRGAVDSSFGGVLAISEYPEATEPGFLNSLLSAPFPLILTQSFTFLSRPVATDLLKRQQNRMISAGDMAESQILDITDALDDLTSGRFVMGEHHLSLTVMAKDLKSLKNNISDAKTNLLECGMVIVREDLAMEAAYWAQLPGNFQYRPRPAPITSKNLAGFASLHNFPIGKKSGNQWGECVTTFKTASGAPYHFNFHAPLSSKKKDDEGKNQQKVIGSTTIIGPSGSGKTAIQAFTLCQLQKFHPHCVVFDKDRGMELCVRALAGKYLPLSNGIATGFNPFQMEPTVGNVQFLNSFVKKLVEGENYKVTVQEEREIAEAVDAVMNRFSKPSRGLRSILSLLDETSEDGAGSRLRKWCESGELAWVFDNEHDELDLSGASIFGFDITDFLDNQEIRTPVVMYLFHRMEQLIDGRRFVCYLDEFWKMLADSYFEDFAQNKLNVIRKQNGFLVMGTQSPAHVLKSSISHTLLEQTATNIYLPNPKASYKDYVEGFKLSKREFEIIKGLPEGSRQFLVKKGQKSVVAELNLKGFDDELAILTGTTDNVLLASKIIAEVGEHPDEWMPKFHELRN